jgi:chitinase
LTPLTWHRNDQGANVYGCVKQLYLLKQANRHIKVLLSIGGWTYSPNFHAVVVDHKKREKFAESSLKLLEDMGLDGLDVDYEYPQSPQEASGYVELLRCMREALDRHAQRKGERQPYELTIAAVRRACHSSCSPQLSQPCGPDHYSKLQIAQMDRHLTFWNLMSYDCARDACSEVYQLTGHTQMLAAGTRSQGTKRISMARPIASPRTAPCGTTPRRA